MLFNSLDYLLFLPLIVVAFYAIPHKFRWVLLLGGSYYFYMCWRAEFVLLIILSTLVDYWSALKMSEKIRKIDKKPFLFLSIFVNLGLLFTYKYYDFFAFNVNLVFDQFNLFASLPYFDLLLPVGISFYTFQTLSYSIDVYNGRAQAEKHLGYFALYVSYFPQLVAGPIERANRLIPQLRRRPKLTKDDVRYAVNKILLGYVKKVVVADTLALYVNQMFGNVSGGNGTQLYLASFLFGVQLFCDFSGYTDIAMGSARLMGVKLMENFKKPYWTMNVAEYWSRWHISLTTWIRDYVFIPLIKSAGKAGKSPLFYVFATVLVMATIGFWHGAKWTFIFFGVYQSFFLLTQRMLQPIPFFKQIKRYSIVRFGYKLFNANVMIFGAIFFRSQSMTDVLEIYTKIFTEFTLNPFEILSAYKFDLLTSSVLCFLLLGTTYFNEELRFKRNWIYISAMIGFILLFGQDTKNQFIYFQF